jgi:hypothetical protein
VVVEFGGVAPDELPTRRGRVIEAEAPASSVCFTADDRGSEDTLAGDVDFRDAWIELPFPGAVDFAGAVPLLFAGTAESSAGCRALPFTANELS